MLNKGSLFGKGHRRKMKLLKINKITILFAAVVMLVSCAKGPEAALLPLPKLVEYTGGSVKADAPVTETLVEGIPEATLNENEAYRLTVTRDGITIEATTPQGLWNGRQTLRQLQISPRTSLGLKDKGMASRGRNDSGGPSLGRNDMRERIPCCRIVDWPSFRVRGWMMDVGRTYVSLEELKREVEIFSQFKVNVFHLHLTEHEAWRLESKRYPQLNAPESMLRQPGKFYTQAEMRELDAFCRERGVMLVPEIDMPGHSRAFERALGYGMQTPQGKETVKALLDELMDTFSSPYIHIGTDEVGFSDPTFVPEMVAHVRAHGRKAVSWNPGWKYGPGEIDATQLWSYRGKAQPGIPAVDCRLHYVNHFDLFGDLIGLHTSTIYGQQEGSDDIAGSIVALWNDRYLTNEENILKENNLYASVLALADRAWRGGGYQYFDGFGTVLPDEGPAREDFLDFERRMLAYRETALKDAPMAYVAQGQARWAISPAYPNEGDLTQAFPPEQGEWATDRVVTGSGIYFRHVWGPSIVAGYYEDPQPNQTVYARTRVWSPKEQTVGLLFETQNYSRSERDPMPPQGQWDYRHSRLWVHGAEVLPPTWEGNTELADYQAPFGNANASGRPPQPVKLAKGWNDVLVKLPVGAFSTKENRLTKWMFTCAFTTPDGRAAADIKYADKL
ncbi:MAG: family 20 glycosylhydrolase [Bacteroidales bacterium]|nr:family 20 glycosylhydrolase [Bacteroidales bacterium]